MITVAVVQARLSSSRFPRKMLADCAGQPLVVTVHQRLSAARHVDQVVVATSTEASDDDLVALLSSRGIKHVRGPLDDVLARYLQAADDTGAHTLVRVTGDCPLVLPEVVDDMVTTFHKGGLDYLSNIQFPSFPDGMDVEIFSRRALQRAAAQTSNPDDREHVTLYLRRHPDLFPSGRFPCPLGDLSSVHLSVDHETDLILIRKVIDMTGDDALLPDVVSAYREITQQDSAAAPSAAARKAFLKRMNAAPRPVITQSDALYARALEVIPAGTQTLSKGPSQWAKGFGPKYLARAAGAYVWDVDGNRFLDYPLGLGPVTLGHAHPEVTEAVLAQISAGNSLSLMHPLEVELAERLIATIPCAERVRFGRNGSDATSACIRAARAKTGRKHVARHGYHGWQDWSIDQTYGIRSLGVPDDVTSLTHAFPYNDLLALERVLQSHDCAAIIMEPVNLTPPEPGYLEGVRDLATRYGAVLVFDEVITGFRYARGGAQEHFGVTPDLCAMGKGMANGMPLSVVAGSAEFMEPFEKIFFSFTFAGETSGLAAAMATLDVMERENYWAHVWRQGQRLQEAYRALAQQFGLTHVTDCKGMPPWTIVTFQDSQGHASLKLKTLFQQEMLRQGVLFSGSQFLSLAHGDDEIEATLVAYREAMRVLQEAMAVDAVDEALQATSNEDVFRRG